MRKPAFTLLELIFVIVIIGILSKFGIELISQAYKNFIFSNINNELQANSEFAVETIASRLQYRIKDSVIARELDNSYHALAGYSDTTAPILEWIGSDIDGFRGDSLPYWSGVIDLNLSSANKLVSPQTDTAQISSLISELSYGKSSINDAAVYFVGSDSDIGMYGWGGVALSEHTESIIHPINAGTNPNEFISGISGKDFSGTDIYEYYQLAWTAYAVGISDYNATSKTGTLMLYYNYRPWKGERYTDGNSSKIMDNVSTFQFRAIGSVVKIQVCVNSDLTREYSLCKEKTIY